MLTELNIDMASLELNETMEETIMVEEMDEPNQTLRRSSRLRGMVRISFNESDTRPDRKSNSENRKGGNSIEQYYLSKQVKRLPSTLETIYEEPKSLNDDVQYMSVKKFKRVLNFEGENSGLHRHKRSKKRLLKAKKVTAVKRLSAKKKISMEVFLRKLEAIEDSDQDMNPSS